MNARENSNAMHPRRVKISTIVAESADHEIEASQMSTQLSAMSTQMAALNRSLLNTIGQQAARITAAEIRMVRLNDSRYARMPRALCLLFGKVIRFSHRIHPKLPHNSALKIPIKRPRRRTHVSSLTLSVSGKTRSRPRPRSPGL